VSVLALGPLSIIHHGACELVRHEAKDYATSSRLRAVFHGTSGPQDLIVGTQFMTNKAIPDRNKRKKWYILVSMTA
jgi:hypothetical protein